MFGVQGLGLSDQSLGIRVLDVGIRVWVLGFESGLGLRDESLRFGDQNLGLKFPGFRFRFFRTMRWVVEN